MQSPPGVGQNPAPRLGRPRPPNVDPPNADPAPDTVNKRVVRILLECILVDLMCGTVHDAELLNEIYRDFLFFLGFHYPNCEIIQNIT